MQVKGSGEIPKEKASIINLIVYSFATLFQKNMQKKGKRPPTLELLMLQGEGEGGGGNFNLFCTVTSNTNTLKL